MIEDFLIAVGWPLLFVSIIVVFVIWAE